MHSTHVPRPANPCSDFGARHGRRARPGWPKQAGSGKPAAATRCRASAPRAASNTRAACTFPTPRSASARRSTPPAKLSLLPPPASPPSVASSPDPPSLWEGPWIPRSPRPSFHCHCHRHRHRPYVPGDLVPLSGRLTERSRHASPPSAPRRPSPVRSIWGHGQGRCMAFHELETPRRC
jgi:hypothetical protein